MQEHFHFTTDQAKIQKQYAAIFVFVSAQLSCIQVHLHRRNRHLVKQEDAVIIAIPSETWEQWIQQKRKVIETVFSVLVDHYRITGIRANSIIGFEVALDGILLAYSLVTLGLVER
ncbi:hypothetical protein B9L21_10610 [Geobacillus uzenensis]|uniref:Transposase n=1 Tax=Geobacillus uzenensis TaxID=129339 RepID=A0ABX4DHU0_9BACL|nr:hypothetical protein [Geobacillus uzenensis]OXB88304.1 hypothetical protein B9L21_10610 [Geobacillus uzenensis]